MNMQVDLCGADPLVRGRPPGRSLAFGRELIPKRRAGPGGPARTRGSAPLDLRGTPSFLKTKWHWVFQPAQPRGARLGPAESGSAGKIARPTVAALVAVLMAGAAWGQPPVRVVLTG